MYFCCQTNDNFISSDTMRLRKWFYGNNPLLFLDSSKPWCHKHNYALLRSNLTKDTEELELENQNYGQILFKRFHYVTDISKRYDRCFVDWLLIIVHWFEIKARARWNAQNCCPLDHHTGLTKCLLSRFKVAIRLLLTENIPIFKFLH